MNRGKNFLDDAKSILRDASFAFIFCFVVLSLFSPPLAAASLNSVSSVARQPSAAANALSGAANALPATAEYATYSCPQNGDCVLGGIMRLPSGSNFKVKSLHVLKGAIIVVEPSGDSGGSVSFEVEGDANIEGIIAANGPAGKDAAIKVNRGDGEWGNNGAPGGRGGNIKVYAKNILLSGSLEAWGGRGGDGEDVNSWGGAHGGNGGAGGLGGTVQLIAYNQIVGGGTIDVSGGNGGRGGSGDGCDGYGHDGGSGGQGGLAALKYSSNNFYGKVIVDGGFGGKGGSHDTDWYCKADGDQGHDGNTGLSGAMGSYSFEKRVPATLKVFTTNGETGSFDIMTGESKWLYVKAFAADGYPVEVGVEPAETVQWSVSNDRYGEVSGSWPHSESALFTAEYVGVVRVIAKSGKARGSITANVLPGKAKFVIVLPPATSVESGHSQQFSAIALDKNGFAVKDFVPYWSVENYEGSGSITQTGLFTADKIGKVRVYASDREGSTRGQAIVVVTPTRPAELKLSSQPQDNQTAGKEFVLTALVFDDNGNIVADGTPVTFKTDFGYFKNSKYNGFDGDEVTIPTFNGKAQATLASNLTGTAMVTAIAYYEKAKLLLVQEKEFASTPSLSQKTIAQQAQNSQYTVLQAPALKTASIKISGAAAQQKPVQQVVQANAIAGAVNTIEATAANAANAVKPAPGLGASASLILHFIPGVAASIDLSANPDTIQVGGKTSEITVEVLDALGNPVADGTFVTFETNAGNFGCARPDLQKGCKLYFYKITKRTANGVAKTLLFSSEKAETATVTASTNGLQANVNVSFVPRAPHEIKLFAPSHVMQGENFTLNVTVSDEYGNPVEDGTQVQVHLKGQTTNQEQQYSYATAQGKAGDQYYWIPAENVNIIVTSGSASASKLLTVQALPAYNISLSAQSPVEAGNSSQITAYAVNSLGLPVWDNTTINFKIIGYSTSEAPKLSSNTAQTINGFAYAEVSCNATGTVTIEASSGSAATQATIVFQAGAPATIQLNAQPTTIAQGEHSQLTALVLDSHGNPVADGTPVDFTVNGNAAVMPQNAFTVNGTAQANFSSTEVGNYTVTATSGAATAQALIEVTALPASQLSVTAQSPVVAGTSAVIDVAVQNSLGLPVADGQAVNVDSYDFNAQENSSCNASAFAVAPQNALTVNGSARFTAYSECAGEATINLSSNNITATAIITFVPAQAASLSFEVQPTTIMQGEYAQLTATLRDQYGNLAEGSVSFASDIGSIENTTVQALEGVASTRFTSIEVGNATINAASGALNASAVVKILPLPPTAIVLTTTSPVEINSQDEVTATVTNALGLPVYGDYQIDFAVTTGNASLNPQSALTVNGVASVNLSSTESGYVTVTANYSNITASTQVLFVGQPATIQLSLDKPAPSAGETVTITANVTDPNGYPAAQGTTVSFTAPSEIAFSSATAQTSNGIASTTFNSTVAGTYTITAFAGSAQAEINVSFQPGQPVRIELTPQNAVLRSGESLQFSAQAFDAYDNPAPTQMQWSASLGNISADGNYTAVRAGNDVVTVSTGAATNSSQVTVLPGALVSLSVNASPSSIQVGGFNSTISVQGFDAAGNLVDEPVIIHFTSTLGNITPSEANLSNGRAEAVLSSGNTAGTAVVSVADTNVFTQTTVEFTAGPAANLAAFAVPSLVPLNGTSTIAVVVSDQYFNPVPQASVSFTIASQPQDANASIEPQLAQTSAAGTASAQLHATIEGNYSVQVAVEGTPLTASVSVEAAPGVGVLEGFVKDFYGNPVANATVSVDSQNASTLADGYYAFSLRSGTYNASAQHAGYLSDSKNITVTDNGVTRVNFTLLQYGRVEGLVRDSFDNLLNDAVVEVEGNGNTSTVLGAYSLELAPGVYNLTAKHASSYDQTVYDVVVITGNSTKVDFVLQSKLAVLSGSVRDSQGNPIPGANVSIESLGQTVSTDAQGNYEFTAIQPGEYEATAQADGFLASTQHAVVVAGQYNSLDFTLYRGATLSGYVLDSTGMPIAAANVTLSNGESALTDANGYYALSAVTPASYEVSVQASGFIPATQQHYLAEGANTANFTLYAYGGVNGSVTRLFGGAPVGGALIQVTQDGLLKGWATTLGDGSYTIGSLEQGYYNVTVSGAGFGQQTKLALVLLGQVTTINFKVY
ncbi:MAG: carboxypeptidase regulatory-like domain-containing protein [Candidatus Micrarchaeia archaeon]